MIISDLNYLESAEANVEGGYFFGDSSVTYVKANISEYLTINKVFNSITNVKGNFAGAEAAADAVGANSSTQAITKTTTVQGLGSSSNATSTSGSAGSYFWHY
ncbi:MULTISPECIES: hypothetical protein [unclassified Microcoleus]|uniref:hypothetical protein n=1 Tax=unclassified Microcoleus TaxID=2642155 RepID=UPI002FD6ABC2